MDANSQQPGRRRRTSRCDVREPRLPSSDEYEQLRATLEDEPMLHLFVTLAWETGARSGELLQLEWPDVDFERHLITLVNDPARGRQTKVRYTHLVPEHLRAVVEHTPGPRMATR